MCLSRYKIYLKTGDSGEFVNTGILVRRYYVFDFKRVV